MTQSLIYLLAVHDRLLDAFNSGVFLFWPNEEQLENLFTAYDHHVNRTLLSEQDLLNEVYHRDGKFPWTQLPKEFNQQVPRVESIENTIVLHDKFWVIPGEVDTPWIVRKDWYKAWGMVVGFSNSIV